MNLQEKASEPFRTERKNAMVTFTRKCSFGIHPDLIGDKIVSFTGGSEAS